MTMIQENPASPASFAPKPLPSISIPLPSALLNGFGRDVITSIENGWRNKGDIFAFQVATQRFIVVSNPEYAKEVLINQREVFLKPAASPQGDLLSLVLGKGLVTNADQESWFSRRRMMQPMFHRRRLGAMASKMTDAGTRMLDRWAALPEEANIDIDQEMMTVTMDIVTQVMFSADVLDQSHEVGEAVNSALKFAFDRRKPINMPLFVPTPANLRFRKARKTLDELVYGLIDERRGHESEFDDLLSMLLEARDEETGEGMARQELRDEVATIFGAGHETTSHTLAWTLYLLAKHPHVMAKLQAEIDDVLQGSPPTLETLRELPYTTMVLEESMRLIPSIPQIPRYVSQPTTIDGIEVPVGLAVISIYNIHRHPDFWDDPEKFYPERMTPEQKKARHRLAWMPFGAGQRLCIGNNMALMESQLLLAQMIQRFDFALVADQKIEREVAVALRPKNGLKMRITRR